MKRPSRAEIFMDIAFLMGKRSTCVRRQVGCVLIDIHNHVVATGYNGVASGIEHCINSPCPGAEFKSGQELDKCIAIHSEANALLQCKNIYEIKDCYVTTSPCINCTKLLLNTSCKNIYFAEGYTEEAEFLWEESRGMGHWKRIEI